MNSARGIFCNRTLNLRSIKAIGYDMDYTLIHYKVDEWERRAYEHTREKLVDRGWPVGSLNFEPDRFVRGLVIDTLTGNILKANRFGYVKRAMHGTRPLDYDRQRDLYARTTVDLGEPRWRFLNTLFSLSESCIFAQLVDLRDDGMISDHLHYADLYDEVRQCLDETHIEKVRGTEIVEAETIGREARVTMLFVTEQANATHDADGELVDGDPDTIETISDLWTFARDTGSRDPNWLLVETATPE